MTVPTAATELTPGSGRAGAETTAADVPNMEPRQPAVGGLAPFARGTAGHRGR